MSLLFQQYFYLLKIFQNFAFEIINRIAHSFQIPSKMAFITFKCGSGFGEKMIGIIGSSLF